MASENNLLVLPRLAGANLTTKIGCAVKLSGTTVVAAGAGEASIGILSNAPESGKAADVCVIGAARGTSGAAYATGIPLAADAAGKLVAAIAGDNVVAVALEEATGAGQVHEVLVVCGTAGPAVPGGVTASAAELNLNDGSIAGTSVASKTLALGANKNTDVLVLPVSGLFIGAGAGTAVTAAAAELNALTGVVAGTVTASKALVVGGSKELDTLSIADGGLKLGAGAGTAIAATAAELNNAADKSAQIQTIAGAGAITVDGSVRNVKLTGAAYAFTLAAPSAAMLGELLHISMTGGGTDAKTLALTNVQGGSAATTASFNADDETLVLVGGPNKWTVLNETGVTLS